MVGRSTPNIVGQKFNRWTVVERSKRKTKNSSYSLWECRCDCGRVGTIARNSLVLNRSKSCGCLRAELNSARLTERHRKRNEQGQFTT